MDTVLTSQILLQQGVAINGDIEFPGPSPIPGLNVVVFFPFQLDIGPHVLRLFTRGIATLTQTAIKPKLDSTIVGKPKFKSLMPVTKG
jgi:hypothetical protein